MSACTKCGYPVGNHPFRHPFAPVMAEGPKPPAPESPYVPLHCGVGDLGELRTRNAALLAEFERLNAERAVHVASIIEHSKQLAAVREALAGERERHDETQRALNLGIDFAYDAADGRPGIETACAIIADFDQRRAAESKAAKEEP